MTTGIMGAMPEEIASIHSHMTNVTVKEHGGRKYYLGKINGHDVVLVFSRWGKVAAAATATSLITEFKIDQLIFTGVAGATATHLNIGDIVIADKLYQHDMDARPLFARHEIPMTGVTFYNTDAALLKQAQLATEGLLAHLSQTIKPSVLEHFKLQNPKCLVGTIATGDQFIYDRQRTEAIMQEKPETVAVEMEGAAVGQVCSEYHIPFVVIRTISDKADHTAELDFPRFINEVAKHYSEHIIQGMLKLRFS